jgi:hypothetical protein
MSSSTNKNNKNEATAMNINKRLGIPNNIAVTGKRKRNNSYNKPIKRRDMSMVADVSRISADKVNITLPRRIVNDLKMINAKSSQERVEYAGKIDFKTSTNNYPQVRFNLPNQLTSHQRGLISNELASLITGYYVTYHTHPAAKSRVNNHNCNNKTRKKLFTLPSGLDFEAYVNNYPSMQANIIADAYGYYVIDIIEASERNGFNPSVFNIYLYRKTTANPNLARKINETMEGIRNLEFMRIRSRSIEGMEYFESTITEWKYTISTELNKYMKDKYGVSVKYYCYGDDPAVITLKRR